MIFLFFEKGEQFVNQEDFRIKFIEDPDGNWIELVEIKKKKSNEISQLHEFYKKSEGIE